MVIGLVRLVRQTTERNDFKAARGPLGGTGAPAARDPKRIRHTVSRLTKGCVPLQAVGVDVGLIEAERQIGKKIFSAAVAGIEIGETSEPFEWPRARAGEPELLRELVIVRRVGRLNRAQPV